MRNLGRTLLVIALFILPAFGQTAPAPAQNTAVEGGKKPATIEVSAPAATASTPLFETAASANPASEAPDPNLGFPILRTLGGLGVVLCLMIGGYFAAKKFAPRFFAKGIADKNLKMIETLSMGEKRSISVIEVGNNRYLVGNTPHQISLLAVLPEGFSAVSEPEKLAASSNDMIASDAAQPFRNLFESEKRRSTQYGSNPLPDHIRMKMRQLRASLER